MTQETAKIPPRPAEPPTSHPYPSPLTRLDRLTWGIFYNPIEWSPLWVTEVTRGLAVQATRDPDGGRWRLALYHEATGLSLASRRPGGHPVEATPTNLRSMLALRAAVLLLPVDWAAEDPRAGCPDLVERVEALVADHLPARREWRAWRADRRNELVCKWHKSAAAAEKWTSRDSGWWLVESWRVPPTASYERKSRPDFAAIGRGDLPEGCDGARWMPPGALAARCTLGGGVVSAFEHGAGSTLADLRPEIIANLEAFAWRPPEHLIRCPTGELAPGEQALLDAGLARIDERGWSMPTRLGIRALSRDVLQRGRPLPTHLETEAALITWQHRRTVARRSWVAPERSSPTSRWTWAERQRERHEAWVLLLACIHRDRQAAAAGSPRFELPSRYQGGELIVLEHEGGLACAEHRCSLGWSWMTWRTRPAVPWAPGSAWAVLRQPDPSGYPESTLHTHGARDWALAAAQERRQTGR